MDVDCVIIGVNAESTLEECIRSVVETNYSRGKVHVYFVDGGSTDRSIEIAQSFSGVHVIEIHPEYPSPGIGRNAGWRKGSSPMVQFLDSDTVLDPGWLDKAIDALTEKVGAVRGNREEINPDASVFNWIGDLEWNGPPGECETFGGDVLIRRLVLEETGGYDDILVGGEDPELSRRVRLKGWKIVQLDDPMTRHDLAMTRVSQYWKRGFRTGYGYAAVAMRHGFGSRQFSIYEFARIIIRGGGSVALAVIGLIGAIWCPWSLFLLLPAALLLFYPLILRASYLRNDKDLGPGKTMLYALHCSFVVLPEFLGILRFLVGKVLSRPLRNKRNVLRTRTSRSTLFPL